MAITKFLHADSLTSTPFDVGAARWQASLSTILTPLIPLLDAGIQPWAGVFSHSHPVARPMRSLWVQWLRQAQKDHCFWCQGPLTHQTLTIEHVLPRSESLWQSATWVERLLALRLSHLTCNQASADWRQRQQPTTLRTMDRRVLQIIRTAIHHHPILQLYQYQAQ